MALGLLVGVTLQEMAQPSYSFTTLDVLGWAFPTPRPTGSTTWARSWDLTKMVITDSMAFCWIMGTSRGDKDIGHHPGRCSVMG